MTRLAAILVIAGIGFAAVAGYLAAVAWSQRITGELSPEHRRALDFVVAAYDDNARC